MSTEIDIDLLALALERTLAQSRIPLGTRLRTEQQIANRLSISRWRLRDALNMLVDRGLISRQRGSGTYLRQLPDPLANPASDESLPAIAVADLFPESPEPLSANDRPPHPTPTARPIQAPPPARQLRIGLLCDLNSDSRTTRQVLAHLIRDINTGGHQLSIQSSTHREINMLTVEEILAQFSGEPCDGYIVQAGIADHFLTALKTYLQGRPTPPVVFYGNNYNPDLQAPIINFNGPAGVAQAFGQFTRQGFTRIGMIRLRRNRRHLKTEPYDVIVEQYESMLRRHGLTYHAIEYTQSRSSESIVDAVETMTRLLKRDQPPEAVYVSDDHLLPGVIEALRQHQCVPGKDLALIVIGHRGRPVPGPYPWSCLEYPPDAISQLAIDTLLRMIQDPAWHPSSIDIPPTWRPGNTHLISP